MSNNERSNTVTKLPYGAIKTIAETVGVSYQIVRYWIRKGKPLSTRMDPEKAALLEKLIAAYRRQ